MKAFLHILSYEIFSHRQIRQGLEACKVNNEKIEIKADSVAS